MKGSQYDTPSSLAGLEVQPHTVTSEIEFSASQADASEVLDFQHGACLASTEGEREMVYRPEVIVGQRDSPTDGYHARQDCCHRARKIHCPSVRMVD